MIRAYGSQNVRGDGGRIKILQHDSSLRLSMDASQKVSTIFDHYLKHADIPFKIRLYLCSKKKFKKN